jgi:hypothetical protein
MGRRVRHHLGPGPPHPDGGAAPYSSIVLILVSISFSWKDISASARIDFQSVWSMSAAAALISGSLSARSLGGKNVVSPHKMRHLATLG